jgi:hypothetical protein
MTLLPAQAIRISVSTAVPVIDTAIWIVATGPLMAYERSACAIAPACPQRYLQYSILDSIDYAVRPSYDSPNLACDRRCRRRNRSGHRRSGACLCARPAAAPRSMLMRVDRTFVDLAFGTYRRRHKCQRWHGQHALRDILTRGASTGRVAFGDTTHDGERAAGFTTIGISRHRLSSLFLRNQ